MMKKSVLCIVLLSVFGFWGCNSDSTPDEINSPAGLLCEKINSCAPYYYLDFININDCAGQFNNRLEMTGCKLVYDQLLRCETEYSCREIIKAEYEGSVKSLCPTEYAAYMGCIGGNVVTDPCDLCASDEYCIIVGGEENGDATLGYECSACPLDCSVKEDTPYCWSDLHVCGPVKKCQSGAIAVSNGDGTGLCISNIDACTSNTDCEVGHLCLDGRCQPGCASDADCPNGMVCDAKSLQCVDKETDLCATVVCPKGKVCQDGKCVADKQCMSDLDCPNGMVCDAKSLQCVDKETDLCATVVCPKGKVCQDGKCVADKQCMSDSDCPDGKFCDAKSHQCVDGVTTCKQDSDCGSGMVCLSGACVEWGSCQTDADCPEGAVCDALSHKCGGPTDLCATVVCPKDTVCQEGKCVVESCMLNSDCGPGMQCVQNICVNNAACKSNKDCAFYETCYQGECLVSCAGAIDPCQIDEICWNDVCSYDLCQNTTCPKGSHCNYDDGKCYEYCMWDEDCESGMICDYFLQECVDAVVCSKDSDCQTAQICENGACHVVMCADDANCPKGSVCVDYDGRSKCDVIMDL